MVVEFRVRFKYKMAIVGDCFLGPIGAPPWSVRLLFGLSRIAPAQSGNHCPTHDPGIVFKYMELAPVYDLSALNQRHFQNFQFLVQRDSKLHSRVSRHAHSSCACRPNRASPWPIFQPPAPLKPSARSPVPSKAVSRYQHPQLANLGALPNDPNPIENFRCPPHQRLPSNRSIRPAPRQPHLTAHSCSCGAAPIEY
jgi:hypothetical protein